MLNMNSEMPNASGLARLKWCHAGPQPAGILHQCCITNQCPFLPPCKRGPWHGGHVRLDTGSLAAD